MVVDYEQSVAKFRTSSQGPMDRPMFVAVLIVMFSAVMSGVMLSAVALAPNFYDEIG